MVLWSHCEPFRLRTSKDGIAWMVTEHMSLLQCLQQGCLQHSVPWKTGFSFHFVPNNRGDKAMRELLSVVIILGGLFAMVAGILITIIGVMIMIGAVS